MYAIWYAGDYVMKELLKEFWSEFKEEASSIKKNGIKTQIPNMLTFSRALAPLLVVPTILLGRIDIAICELVLFELTDFLDGRLARKYNCVSKFGIKLDAVCDKLFALGIMIPAIIKYPVLVINLILELCISYINMLSELKNNNPKSNMVGKIKTVFLSITLVLAYLPKVDGIYVLMASIFTFMFQIGAFVKYRESDLNKDKEKEKKEVAIS